MGGLRVYKQTRFVCTQTIQDACTPHLPKQPKPSTKPTKTINQPPPPLRNQTKKAAKPGVMEYQLESLFRHVTYNDYGCRNQGVRCFSFKGEGVLGEGCALCCCTHARKCVWADATSYQKNQSLQT